MNKLLTNKYFWLMWIVIGLQIPLSMVEHQIEQRSAQRDIAKNSVRSSWTGEQEIFVGLLAIPYQQKVALEINNHAGNHNQAKFKWIAKTLYLTPQTLELQATLTNQALAKGIFTVPVFTAKVALQGQFNLQPLSQLKQQTDIRFDQAAFISIGIKDSRGLVGIPQVTLLDKKLAVEPGSGLQFYPSGFNATVPQQLFNTSELSLTDNSTGLSIVNFTSQLQVNGMEELLFLTAARQNKVSAQSDWPHPIFSGAFLPMARQVDRSGYTANWQTGVFSTNMNTVLENCYKGQCEKLHQSNFGVKHVQSVDIYLQSLRSIKYGLLVILVTFCIFALYEIITQKLSVHPVSYLLTGASLAIFFLLLVALSEHLSFLLAYWISCLACSGLIAFYAAHQSRHWLTGLSLMVILNALYLILFFIIRSEDHALLSGSLLLFLLLAMVMFVTRKIDWYGVLQSEVSVNHKS